MDPILKSQKFILRDFMRRHYTDERLAMLLAHARDGRLAYFSCCCFIGVVTADHALQNRTEWPETPAYSYHYNSARELPRAAKAEAAYCSLGYTGGNSMWNGKDELRLVRLIPMIRAEMRRRAKLLTQVLRRLETNPEVFTTPAALPS